MLNLKVIGAGAAGNKAAIKLIEKGFSLNNTVLINSTSRDIPDDYKNNSIIFGTSADTLGGCGKEREVGKNLILRDLRNGSISLDNIVDPGTNVVVIVSSTEGGSGSAVTPIIAKYIREVLNIPVITILFFGFNTDVRGMQNSIEICQELSNNYGVIGISNAKFLDDANGNKIKAEQLANEEFCRIIRVLSGQDIKAGTQNIDDTDLYKLVVTPGYMCVGSANLKSIKNIDMFNKTVNTAIDETKLIESSEKSAKRIGVIFDIPTSMDDAVDYNASVLSQRYGVPYEMFTHIQNISATGTATWIAAGMDLPIQEVKEIFENYKAASETVSKKKDSFFDDVAALSGNQEDGMFNMLSGIGSHKTNPSKNAKSSFFSDFGITGDN